MFLLVDPKLDEFGNHCPGRETRHQDLARIDVDCTVLAGVIDLENAAPEIRTDNGPSYRFHDV